MALKIETIEFDKLTADPAAPAEAETWYRDDTDSLMVKEGAANVKVRNAKEITGKVVEAVTTKGDLLVYDGAQFKRLAAGTNGQQLEADSAAATGVAWKDPQGGLVVKAGTVVKATFDADLTGIKTATVTFTAAYADTNYSVTLTPVVGGESDGFNPRVLTKLGASFVISLGTANTAGLIGVDWHTVNHGEF